MPAATQRDVMSTIEGLNMLIREAGRRPSVEAFETLEQQLGRFDVRLREMQQENLGARAKAALSNLRGGRPLSEEDKAVLRSLVVGDAESYLKMENNLHDWMNELARLEKEMERLAADGSDESLLQLRGVVRDAMRLMPSIRGYMDERARLDRFCTAMSSLDEANRNLLVQVVNEMLSSRSR